MTLEYRSCQPSDKKEVVPLIYSAGPEAFRYVFSVDYREQAIDFLHYAFAQKQGEFGYQDHTVALYNNNIVGVVGRRCHSQNLAYTFAAMKQIFGFYGVFKGLKVIVRGLRFESIVTPPSKNSVCLHNLGVSPEYRSKGYGQQIIEYFINRERNLQTTQVCLDVAETNPRAKVLYLRLGFVVKVKKQGRLSNKYGRGVTHEHMEIALF